jgi:MFS family permease
VSSSGTTFQSFRERNYRLFFVGQTVSQCGNWLQTMALAWLVLDLSHKSGFAVGLSVALQFVPTLALSVWTGVLADRFDKRRLLVVANVAMAAIALLFLVLDVTGVVQLWMIYVIVFVYGIFFALDYPTRQAFVPEMVTAADLPNAIGLSSASLQSARIVGPAIAGATIVLVGTSACFALNAASYVVVLGALFMMRPKELHRGEPVKREPGQIREGFRYMWSTPELRATLLMLVVVGTFAIVSPVILPLMAKLVFHGDADVYSWLTIAMGCGALVGALLWARHPRARADMLVVAGFVYGGLILVAAALPSLGSFIAVLVAVGAAQTWFLAASSSLVQLTAAPSMRGRVMAVYTLAVVGSTPIGGPIVGWLSEQFGTRWAYAVGGFATIAACAAFGPTLYRARRKSHGVDTDVVLGVDGEAIPASIR